MTTYILLFLLISFGYSLFEKLKDKTGYVLFLNQHLKTDTWGVFFWWFLVTTNTITTLCLLTGIFTCLLDISVVYKVCATNIILLLIGQRIAGDYQGAANLGIYFIIILFGWYML